MTKLDQDPTTKSGAVERVDRAAIFTATLKRNALRREAWLPLLDVRAVYQEEVDRALWQAHLNAHRCTVQAEVTARIRARLGPEQQGSVGMRWRIHIETQRILRERFHPR